MRKNHFILFLLFLLIANVCPMYSTTNSNHLYYILKIDRINDGEWDEIDLWILTGGGTDKSNIVMRSLAMTRPLSLLQNDSYLKAIIRLDEKINIKISNENNVPVYMRQYNPGESNEIMIETSDWSSGYYDVVFTNSTGVIIAKGTVFVH